MPGGFTVGARSGATGQALVGSVLAGSSAKAAFSTVLKRISPYFNRAPALVSPAGDIKDQQAVEGNTMLWQNDVRTTGNWIFDRCVMIEATARYDQDSCVEEGI